MPTAGPSTLPVRMPPCRKSSVPVATQVQMMASSWMPIDVLSRMPR